MGRRTVLVTGAAGLVGSHTAEKLIAQGDSVIGLDNFNDYYDPQLKKTNVQELHKSAGFTLIEGDIRNRELVDRLFSTYRFDAVVHLAAMAGVRASVEDARLYYDVNVGGTLNLLESAREQGRPLFVFASTSSAYGRTERVPFVETDQADTPLAPYPASKRACELLGHSYHHVHGMDFTALRFFTVYGPRNRPDMLAHLALDAGYRGKELALYENGELWRDWTYVDDITDGIVRASSRRLGYQIINLGRGEPVLLRDFVSKLAEKTGRSIRWKSQPLPTADVARTWASIDKARRLLGYHPSIDVEEGIERLVRWYERQYQL